MVMHVLQQDILSITMFEYEDEECEHVVLTMLLAAQ